MDRLYRHSPHRSIVFQCHGASRSKFIRTSEDFLIPCCNSLLHLQRILKTYLMIRNRLLLTGLIMLAFTSLFAKEGMWIPTLLNKYNIDEMKQMGFKLTAEDIYSVNQVSMKDAVVI